MELFRADRCYAIDWVGDQGETMTSLGYITKTGDGAVYIAPHLLERQPIEIGESIISIERIIEIREMPAVSLVVYHFSMRIQAEAPEPEVTNAEKDKAI